MYSYPRNPHLLANTTTPLLPIVHCYLATDYRIDRSDNYLDYRIDHYDIPTTYHQHSPIVHLLT